ncbi:MAG: tRNA uridine-5-carboxymethylaminomethyl(34) synthesis enzyme MnmG [Gammaproteobacteria bacterium]|nr:tRNA uridine-5-carboxymethylaminomethyl(34) synthesis enzyme MnmG [Gammaproteobacteria bacterium]
MDNYDVIVIGGGHAGTEACLASARSGCKTLLITQRFETIGQMSCNPSIGGIGKGHLAKEVDALGGAMARAADLSGIHFRTLNKRKGPAVWATRAQADRELYKKAIQGFIRKQKNLKVCESEVIDILVDKKNLCHGVELETKEKISSKTVILTTGTFLSGKIFIGEKSFEAGRAGDKASNKLAKRLRDLGLPLGRLKTGTPPRLDGKTIDFSVLKEQAGDDLRPVFSFFSNLKDHPRQISCYIARTNNKTHEVIRDSLNKSPAFNGVITGKGPRYCPSIEDKVTRFKDKESHQIFLEPEGLNTNIVYPNGISTSLPEEDQEKFIRTIPGLTNVKIEKFGYAVEYDFLDPRGLSSFLENKAIKNLFLAGQINGTTGYEEAASQGIAAGINAAQKALGREMWPPERETSYIGVMIDDLINQGAPEPYRMFTSRAENRLYLREDNVIQRLSPCAEKYGLLEDNKLESVKTYEKNIEEELAKLKKTKIDVDGQTISAYEYLRRPNTNYEDIEKIKSDFTPAELQEVGKKCAIEIKYEGYVKRQKQDIKKSQRDYKIELPEEIDYNKITALSTEARENLSRIRPKTLLQASKISGITPASLSILKIQAKVNKNNKKVSEKNARS